MRRPVIAVIAAAAVISTGCSGGNNTADPSPTGAPSTTATSTPTATPSATPTATKTPPLTPAKAAEAAVLNYFEALNKAIATMDSGEVRKLVAPDCKCLQSIGAIDTVKKAGNRIRLVYRTLGAVPHAVTANRAEVTYSFDINENVIVDAAGRVVQTHPTEKNGLKEVFVERRGSRWIVTRVISVVD